VADGHGKSVLEQFYKGLSKEQLASIRTVSGDATRWITECANEPAHSASAVSIHSMSLSGPQMCWMKSAKTVGVLLYGRAKQLPAEATRPKANDQAFSRVQAVRKKATAISLFFWQRAKSPDAEQKDLPGYDLGK